MPITLEESKVGMADKVVQSVIDDTRRGSFLLEKMIFDNAVSPGTGGSTLTYGYVRTKTPGTAGFREINSDYTPQEAKREKHSVELKIFGGSFEIDRVIAKTSGAVNEVQYQVDEKVKATINTFHYTAINGDKAVKGFDGLDVMLAGSSTELNTDPANAIDLSTKAAMDANYVIVMDWLDSLLAELDGEPTLFMGNGKLITKLISCARRAGYYTRAENAFGRKISAYNDVPLIDLKYYYDPEGKKEVPVVPIVERDSVAGLTDLYVARLDINGFHAVSPLGDTIIDVNLPQFTTAGAVKKGDVEMVAATALKKTRAAGVLRNIKVQ